jgi:HlyD family secretion protein
MNQNASDAGTTPPKRLVNRVSHKRRWLPYAGLMLLVAIIVAGLWPQPMPVETTQVVLGPLRSSVNEEGKTRIKHRFVVSAPVAGQLRRLTLKAGDEVREGETKLAVIAPLSPALLDARNRAATEARRDAATANLEKSRAAQNFAASELNRFKKLYADKTVSVQELETAQWREASASRELAAAESAVRQAEAELAEFAPRSDVGSDQERHPVEVKSPASGKVLHVFEENARVVSPGMPLLEIGNPADLEVVIDVLSRDGAGISPGTPVELDHWGGGPPLAARVRMVEPAAFTKVSALGVEEQRVNVIADFVAPPDQRSSLGDQFRVEAHIITWQTNQTLKVASGALFRHGQRWAVFVSEGGRARLRTVEVGRASGPETQILSGLQAGQEVILYPGDRVHDGQRIRKITI